jgi:Carboxypeptidase regulatory-like domain
MKIGKSVCVALTLVAILLVAAGAGAQNLQRGEVRGFVFDTQHALVPNAKVTISNPSTGYKHEITTDSSGSYGFPQLLPGVYQIKAEAAGFASITITDLVVEIGASLAFDITLPVKGQTTTVTVSAAAAGPVDTSTAGINQVINQKNLEDLPLSGRDYRDLAELSSSAQVVPGLRGGIRLGGQQSDYLGMVIDGQDSFNNFFGEIFGSLETKNFTIPLDAVQEFQVVTNGFAPEFGRATGGLVNVITKSGTNELHGEAHEYYRGDRLTKDDAVGEPPNITNQNQFGGSVGFPIHKDRQFLFLATDIQRENGPLVSTGFPNATGPSFAACAPGHCPLGEVPLPGPGTAGLFLPAACNQNPTAGDLVLKDCYGVTNLDQFNGPHNQLQNLFTLLGHYDYQFSPANHFSIRGYGTRNHTSGFTGGLGQNETPAAFGETENFINQGVSGVFALNTVLGRKVNEIRVSIEGETRKRHSNGPGEPTLLIGSLGTVPPPQLAGQRYYLPINGDNGKLQAADNFSYSFGKHDIKFGGDVDVFTDRKDSFVGWNAGSYVFKTLADFNNGLVTGTPYSQDIGLNNVPLFQAGTIFYNYQGALGLYWQDKWAITPKFTLTYGVRWDNSWNPQPQTPFAGQCAYVGHGAPPANPTCAPTVGPGTSVASMPQRVPNDHQQWGPRIGFAWNVGSNEAPTVVRGAWGYYYAQTPTIFLPTAGGGRTAGDVCFNLPACAPAGGNAFPYIFPTTVPEGVDGLCGSANPAIGCPGPNYVDPKFRNPRVSNLTGSVEHTFWRSWTVTATFAWENSAHLRTGGYGTEEAWARNFVPVPGAGGVDQFGRTILSGETLWVGGVPILPFQTLLDPTQAFFQNTTASFAHGNYESAVLNLTKRFSSHFQVFANYIWSQNKDNGASERDTDTYFGQQDPFNINLDYGRNSLDIKHQFKAAGVYELPMGFAVSASVIAHSGVPFPLYVGGTGSLVENGFTGDINGDLVGNSTYFHNNDRPSLAVGGGKAVLVGRYPYSQPGFAQLDARLQKDFRLTERYHALLSADFFNLTNRGNVYSNPDTNGTIDYGANGNCVPRTPGPLGGNGVVGTATSPIGFNCGPLAALPPLIRHGNNPAALGFINQIAPGSTPFAFQAGFKFIF